jgi:hypothetical protein
MYMKDIEITDRNNPSHVSAIIAPKIVNMSIMHSNEWKIDVDVLSSSPSFLCRKRGRIAEKVKFLLLEKCYKNLKQKTLGVV